MKTTFQHFLLPQLGDAGAGVANLHEWFRSGRLSSAEYQNNTWHLETYSNSELYQAFTPDFQRFSFSSFETYSLANLERDHCFSVGWPLLKLYYSAFFAAHAMTRATGNGQVNLNRGDVEKVNDYLSLVGRDDRLDAGTYNISIKEGSRNNYLVLKASTGGGGVHDGFWRYFCEYLGDLATEAVTDALPSASDFLRETNTLSSCIQDSSRSGVWFSATRNAINYRHEYECWLPNSKKSEVRKLIFPSGTGDPDTMEASLNVRDNELSRLINLSSYLAGLNYHNILKVKGEVSGNSQFSQRWKRLETAILDA